MWMPLQSQSRELRVVDGKMPAAGAVQAYIDVLFFRFVKHLGQPCYRLPPLGAQSHRARMESREDLTLTDFPPKWYFLPMTIYLGNQPIWVIVRIIWVNYHEHRLIREGRIEDMVTVDQIGNMLTLREVAQLLHVHPNTLRRWSDAGRISAYRVNPRGDRRFKKENIERYLAEMNTQR